MKAYRVASSQVVEPFGDRALECPIYDKPLIQHQAATFKQLGLEVIDVLDRSMIQEADEHIIFVDYLFCLPKLLQEFIQRSQAQKSNTVCALKPGITTLRTVTATQTVKTFSDRVEYQLYYVPAAAQRGSQETEPQPIIIDPDQVNWPLPMPPHMFGSEQYCLPMTEQLLVQIEHWSNLWMANVSRMLLTGAGLKQAPAKRLLGLALKARSLNQWTILKQFNQIGKNCDIHPTAYIENAIIGDNVTIGAGAVVRTAVVGNGSAIGNNAVVELSVLGDRCNVMNDCTMQMSMAFSGLFTMSKLISASICGRDTFVGDGVTLTDFRMDNQTIPVMHNGKKIDSANQILGCCLGHNVYLGAGAIVAPGRSIPNGLRFIADPERMIRMNAAMMEESGFYQVTKV
jgi:carbonic anhydrase/acetyltransferase-like protein (isoleucine patch superfamily)